MIVGMSCVDANIRYAITNYIYARLANQIKELQELEVAPGKPFRCWVSEAGHLVMTMDENRVAAVNLMGYKNPPIAQLVFPKVRAYSLFDSLKYLTERFYGAPYEKLYSINIDKEKYSKVLTYQGWLNDLASSIKRYDENALYNAVFRTIEEDDPEIALITDVTTTEDVKAIQAANGGSGKVVHILTEKLYGGAKKGLDLTIYDAVVDARELKLWQTLDCVKDVFESWGIWL